MSGWGFGVQIDTLNDELAIEMSLGRDVISAVDIVAGEWDLDLVRESEDGQLRLYWCGNLRCHINCWMEGVLMSGVGEGGVGFDDQVELWAATF